MPSPAAKPTSWRIGMAASAASRSRLRWSWCRAPRPMVRPSVAAVGWTGALIWDANLGFGAGAAQEFRFVDERDAERLGLVALRAGISAHDQRRRLLRDAVGHVAAGRLDQFGRPGAGEGGQRSGHDLRLTGQRALALRRRRLIEVQSHLLQPVEQPAVLRLV